MLPNIYHLKFNTCLETSYEVGLNMTNVKWTDDLHNKSSKAYQDLLAKFLEEVS